MTNKIKLFSRKSNFDMNKQIIYLKYSMKGKKTISKIKILDEIGFEQTS